MRCTELPLLTVVIAGVPVFVAFRRVYDTAMWGTLWRMVTVVLLFSAALILTVFAIAAPTAYPFMFGQPSP